MTREGAIKALEKIPDWPERIAKSRSGTDET
jgi:hypothetical protein